MKGTFFAGVILLVLAIVIGSMSKNFVLFIELSLLSAVFFLSIVHEIRQTKKLEREIF